MKRRNLVKIHCPLFDDEGRIVPPAGGRLAALAMEEMDWIDSTFAEPSWDPADFDLTMPSPMDDEAFVEGHVDALVAATDGLATATQVDSAVSAYLSQHSMDAERAAIVGEAASILTASATYWEGNYNDWVDQYCVVPDDGLDHPAPPECPLVEDSHAIGSGQLADYQLSQSDRCTALCQGAWDFVKEDVYSVVGIYELIGLGYLYWENRGKSMYVQHGQYKYEVRGANAVTRQQLKQAAGKIARRMVMAGAVGMAAESALAAWTSGGN